jgi:glutamate 5-kinase
MSALTRQQLLTQVKTVVVKIGTRSLTRTGGTLNEDRIAELAGEIDALYRQQHKVVLVSSGAVGAGMGLLGLKSRPSDLPHLQAVAAVGQSYLVQAYERALRALGRHAAQILLTAEDLESRPRYVNVRNTISTLLEIGAVPIINENDTVSVEELQTTFGDNDRLAALVTNLMQAGLLILLSDVDGLYDGDPSDVNSRVIPHVPRIDESVEALVRDKLTGLSKGGMASKLRAARIATHAGESVLIANGLKPDTLTRLFAGEPIGTLFTPQGPSVGARKRWIGFSVQPRGHLTVDDGARQAVERNGRSLLPIGIVEATGIFGKGDVIALRDRAGTEFARGLSNYSGDDVRRIQGLRTEEIVARLGQCTYPEVIHRDNLVLTRQDAAGPQPVAE